MCLSSGLRSPQGTVLPAVLVTCAAILFGAAIVTAALVYSRARRREVILYCRLKCELERGRDIHQYGTRGRDNFRLDQHRTTAYGRLPSQVGVRLINRLPEGCGHCGGRRWMLGRSPAEGFMIGHLLGQHQGFEKLSTAEESEEEITSLQPFA
ncbi:hypothetical protein J6590_103814 [Homalodisca vitripennis]|nr:hypothetical protein J6590_103814 [Homalodisca vitripennis]